MNKLLFVIGIAMVGCAHTNTKPLYQDKATEQLDRALRMQEFHDRDDMYGYRVR